ncbi:hypothetical protein Vadar_020287 [Vaccinium darrowii]|uniref:Uncharacterized protein n=1 Tax=Vaccinium darrowii TaxID=229202 RepID=A0ACB7Y809_9ERIC|nr:hypothetical protein Vadar_020287 [Vaccinium darrowii]
MEAFHSIAASERETMVNKLYEASIRGNVQALDALMEKDELILDRVSLTCFDETPAHIAAMRGHVDFMRVLLSHKPKLASHLDSLGRSPLHVACAEGHANIVCELLGVDNRVCWVHDGDGRTPLHLAVAKGQVEVMRELLGVISRRVESTRERVQVLKGGGEGESVLHLCVKYNRSKALKLVVEWMRSIDDDGEHDSIINSKDKDGNTILHLAAALKQKETIEYLLQIPSVKAVINSKNQNGFTALDVLEVYPIRDLKSMEIRDILLLAGVQRACGDNQLLEITPTDHHHLESPPPVTTRITTTAKIISKEKQLISNTWKKFFKLDNKWMEEARGNLIMSASVIAAMAFQGALSPPGDVWQDYNNGTINENGINLLPGTSIAGSYSLVEFNYFLIPNTVSLMASLSTILLAISGFPLKNRLAVWLLMTTMCTSVASMALAYLYAISIVLPAEWDWSYYFYNGVLVTWLGICGLVMLIHTIRFFTWLFERRSGFFKKKIDSKTSKV